MANQPTKYSKFLIGAASAALVASAVAPVASAADFKDTKGNTHEAAIDALSDAGVITGYTDGTFKPNKTLTRSDVVKLMGKWLVAEGSVVPTDYKTNMRFADLKSTSNDELLKYAAVVKDNGVFVGTVDGKLNAAGDISRENMAVVLVRAFDRVHDIDLTSYVAGKDFKKDVTDLGKAKAEARPAIDVLDFFDITNPAAPAFNPKGTTTRGQFATFLYKTTKADFSDVTTGVVVGVAGVKAVNATTVEVTFKEKVENINSLDFKIDGLTVSNAAVKQTDAKTVVLTTAVQKGGEKYTVTLNGKAIGSFNGVSAVIPTTIDLITKSVQGIVGNQAILSAYVGVKEAGIPVTFNVKANTSSTLNEDQVFEVLTNADGIAQFSYTQYGAGVDQVTAYPTGAATLRSTGTVYWANSAQLSIKDITEATTLANGSKKVYEINSAKNAGGYVFVTFEENLNVTPDKAVRTATIEGVSTYTIDGLGKVTGSATFPYQYSTTGTAVTAVKLDASGKANLVVTGSNAKVTPIVFEGTYKTLVGNSDVITDASAYSKTALQAKASTVSFELKHELGLTLKAEGVQNAATYLTNEQTGGRDYTATYFDKDAKAAAPGTQVLVALPVAGGNTFILDADGNEQAKVSSDNLYNYFALTVGSKGEVGFTVASKTNNNYVAPIVFINNSNASTTLLDTNDLQAQGEITYFVSNVSFAAELSALNAAGKPVSAVVANQETAYFTYSLVDQNGKPRAFEQSTNVAFEVKAGTGAITVGGTTIAPGNTTTVRGTIPAGQTSTNVGVFASTPSSVTVTATGSRAGVVLPSTNPASVTVNFSQYGTSAVTGPATAVNTTLDVFTVGNVLYNYATGTYKYNGSVITKSAFEGYIAGNTATVSVTVDADGKFTFDVIATNTGISSVVDAVNASNTAGQVKAALANYPGYAALSTSIKDFIATELFAAGIIFNETSLNANYETEYDSAVQAEITQIDGLATTAAGTPTAANYTAFANSVGDLPGSSTVVDNLKAVTNVTTQTAIANAVAGLTAPTAGKASEDAAAYLVLVQNAITTALAAQSQAPVTDALSKINAVAVNDGATLLAALQATNTVDTTKTNAAVLGLDLTAVDAADLTDLATELHSLKPAAGFTAINAPTLFNSAVAWVKDEVAPKVASATYAAPVSPSTAGTLTITFSENVVPSGTIALADFTFGTGGTTASTVDQTATLTGNKLVISVDAATIAAGFTAGQSISALKLETAGSAATVTLTDDSLAANSYVFAPFEITVVTP